MKRIRHSQNARFILTTRAYVFEEARRTSEHLADQRLDISKYVLDVGAYTRRIRARILYNHLLIAGTPPQHIRALVKSGKIPKIVDHPNYNPRVISWMTDPFRVNSISPTQYTDEFINALENPKQLWDTAFRTHIPQKCRHLLFSLFFASQYGEEIHSLRTAFQSLHTRLCALYGHSSDPKDFDESLKILEGSFVTIRNGLVSFVNPSFRDYLTTYLNDLSLLKEFALGAKQGKWDRQLWDHGKKLADDEQELADFAKSFICVSEQFLHIPVWKKSTRDPHSYRINDLGNSDRIALAVDWWAHTKEKAFANVALSLARNPRDGFSAYMDGYNLVQLISAIRAGYYTELPSSEDLVAALEEGIIGVLEGGPDFDDLDRICDSILGGASTFSADVIEAASNAINRGFAEIDRYASEIDSESTLSDLLETLDKLAARGQVPGAKAAAAKYTVVRRLAQLADETEEAESPSFSGATAPSSDKFDDKDLVNLFASLLDINTR